MRLGATSSFSTLREIATHRGADPAVLAAKIESWTARLPGGEKWSCDAAIKLWMRWEQALRLADTGRADEGRTLIERDLKPFESDPTGYWTYAAWASDQAIHAIEIELRAGRGDRAEAWLSACEGAHQPDRARQRVRVLHAQGRAVDEETLEAMRAEPSGDHDNWHVRQKIARVEGEQARLAGAQKG